MDTGAACAAFGSRLAPCSWEGLGFTLHAASCSTYSRMLSAVSLPLDLHGFYEHLQSSEICGLLLGYSKLGCVCFASSRSLSLAAGAIRSLGRCPVSQHWCQHCSALAAQGVRLLPPALRFLHPTGAADLLVMAGGPARRAWACVRFNKDGCVRRSVHLTTSSSRGSLPITLAYLGGGRSPLPHFPYFTTLPGP